MQTALGFGISRNKMILARFFECLILLIECHVFIMLLTFLYATICGASGVMAGLTGYLWIVALKILGFLCLAMILVYGTQKPTLGLVLFILLNADLFAFIVELIDMIPFLKDNDIKLHNVFPSGMIMNIDDAAHAGKIGETIARIILFIAVYVVVPVIISMRLFGFVTGIIGLILAIIMTACFAIAPAAVKEEAQKKGLTNLEKCADGLTYGIFGLLNEADKQGVDQDTLADEFNELNK